MMEASCTVEQRGKKCLEWREKHNQQLHLPDGDISHPDSHHSLEMLTI